MADLRNEGGNPLDTDDLVTLHRRVQYRYKNAGFGAGVREDLQGLLVRNGHTCLQAKKSRSMAGIRHRGGSNETNVDSVLFRIHPRCLTQFKFSEHWLHG
jgi:hypothetical protein